jgi:hypothetical protein
MMQGVALSSPAFEKPKTVQEMWEDVDRLRHPEKYMKADPAAARQEPRGLYVPPGYSGRAGGGGAGGFGLESSEAVPYLQEPLQPGMFAGTVTFLSAEVDPHDSELAAAAIIRSGIRGDNIVRGVFSRSPEGGSQ